MFVPKERHVAEHLVTEDNHIILASQCGDLLQFFFFPHDANRILRVAHDHESRFLLNENTLQVVKVHSIEMVTSGYKVVTHR